MYLGIDFLLTPDLDLFVSEVNVGLPGGASEFDRTHIIHLGRSSGIYEKIDEISRDVYGLPFPEYVASLPYFRSLKAFKFWIDGTGPFPEHFHPVMKLEDKWIQHLIIGGIVPMAETMALGPTDEPAPADGEADVTSIPGGRKIFDPRRASAEEFIRNRERSVLKKRLGRGGRGLRLIGRAVTLDELKASVAPAPLRGFLLQEYIRSRIADRSLSLRAVAFGGRFVCMYANLSKKDVSNHGLLAYVKAGDRLSFDDRGFSEIHGFDEKSWEAELWFGADDPPEMHHNLYEDEVTGEALILPAAAVTRIQSLAVRIERLYESLDFAALPRVCFERRKRG